MALNINWQGPQTRNLDVTSAMQGNRDMLSKAGQGVGTFIKNYRKYKADQEMKGFIEDYNNGKGERQQRMQQILSEIKKLEAENNQIRQQLEASKTDTSVVFNWG